MEATFAVHTPAAPTKGTKQTMAARRIGALMTLARLLTGKRGASGASAWKLMTSIPSMLKAFFTGKYTGLSMGKFVGMIIAAVYIFSPVDIVPELFLQAFGLVDDAMVVAWLGGALLEESDRYVQHRRSTRLSGEALPGELVE